MRSAQPSVLVVDREADQRQLLAGLLRLSRTTLIDKIHRLERDEPAPAA
jgi:hypothetical protein